MMRVSVLDKEYNISDNSQTNQTNPFVGDVLLPAKQPNRPKIRVMKVILP